MIVSKTEKVAIKLPLSVVIDGRGNEIGGRESALPNFSALGLFGDARLPSRPMLAVSSSISSLARLSFITPAVFADIFLAINNQGFHFILFLFFLFH